MHLNGGRKKRFSIMALCTAATIAAIAVGPLAIAGNPAFPAEALIEEPFKSILTDNPELTAGVVRVVRTDPDTLALLAVARVIPSDQQAEDRQSLVRIGAIQARTTILKFSHGVEISSIRGGAEEVDSICKLSDSMSLSTFFQVTEERVSAAVEQLPVVGTWWDDKRNVFSVAVGAMKRTDAGADVAKASPSDAAEPTPSASEHTSAMDISGEPLFLALLHAVPVLRDNGGVRVFLINDRQKAIMAVASADINTTSLAKAERVARIKAARELLAHKNGITLSSVETLADYESIRITNAKSTHVMLPEFLSMQEESVSGFVKALPVVARWAVAGERDSLFFVCIGKIF